MARNNRGKNENVIKISISLTVINSFTPIILIGKHACLTLEEANPSRETGEQFASFR